MINLKYLECFLDLSESLSFSKTAKNLNIAQSAVSRQIKLLEEQLATTLFIRNKGQVRTTAAGEGFYKEVKVYFHAIISLSEKTRRQTDDLSGSISVSLLSDVGQNIFFPHLLEFSEKHKEIQMHVEYGRQHEIVDQLEKGLVDFGVVNTSLEKEKFRSYPLFKEKVVLVSRRGLPMVNHKSGVLRMVGYRQQDWLAKEYFSKNKMSAKVNSELVFSVNNRRSMIEVLLRKDCYAVVPLHSVEAFLKSRQLQLASDHILQNTLYLVGHDYAFVDKRLTEFRNFLLGIAKQKKYI